MRVALSKAETLRTIGSKMTNEWNRKDYMLTSTTFQRKVNKYELCEHHCSRLLDLHRSCFIRGCRLLLLLGREAHIQEIGKLIEALAKVTNLWRDILLLIHRFGRIVFIVKFLLRYQGFPRSDLRRWDRGDSDGRRNNRRGRDTQKPSRELSNRLGIGESPPLFINFLVFSFRVTWRLIRLSSPHEDEVCPVLQRFAITL